MQKQQSSLFNSEASEVDQDSSRSVDRPRVEASQSLAELRDKDQVIRRLQARVEELEAEL